MRITVCFLPPKRKPAHNSTYKKLAVQWLNEALCFISNTVLADSLMLRNRQLLVAAKCCVPFLTMTLVTLFKNCNLIGITNL
jgi:hypothetical protein